MKKKYSTFKRIAVLIIIFIMLVFAACGNHSLGVGKFTFRKIHIFVHDGPAMCLTVTKWYECDIGIEVRTKEYGSLWLSEGTYMLCENECPICGREE